VHFAETESQSFLGNARTLMRKDSLNQGMIERLAGPMIIRSGSTIFDLCFWPFQRDD
jgi:hypothetical protein